MRCTCTLAILGWGWHFFKRQCTQMHKNTNQSSPIPFLVSPHFPHLRSIPRHVFMTFINLTTLPSPSLSLPLSIPSPSSLSSPSLLSSSLALLSSLSSLSLAVAINVSQTQDCIRSHNFTQTCTFIFHTTNHYHICSAA